MKKGKSGTKNARLSQALKGNDNAKGHGAARAGIIGAAFGPVGSVAGGLYTANKANYIDIKANKKPPLYSKTLSGKVIKRNRKASAITGGLIGAATGAAIAAATGNSIAAGAVGGAAGNAALNYGGTRLGQSVIRGKVGQAILRKIKKKKA